MRTSTIQAEDVVLVGVDVMPGFGDVMAVGRSAVLDLPVPGEAADSGEAAA